MCIRAYIGLVWQHWLGLTWYETWLGRVKVKTLFKQCFSIVCPMLNFLKANSIFTKLFSKKRVCEYNDLILRYQKLRKLCWPWLWDMMIERTWSHYSIWNILLWIFKDGPLEYMNVCVCVCMPLCIYVLCIFHKRLAISTSENGKSVLWNIVIKLLHIHFQNTSSSQVNIFCWLLEYS